MSKTREITEQVGRWRMAGIAILLGATITASGGAQQTTPGSAGARTTPCPVVSQSNGSLSPSVPDATAAAPTTGATTANNGTNGTPTDAATTAGVAANPTPNNTSTNPSQRLTGLNATNGANGVGADTTTTGKRVPPVAEQIPADTTRTGATVCAPSTGKGPG
jgi:hypothetical protein